MIDEKKLIEEVIPILNEHGDMYLTGRIIGLIDSQPRTDYSQRSKAYAQGYSDGCVDTKEKSKTDWIPCEERLPDTYDNLLICQSDGYVNVGYYSLNEFKDMNSYPYKDVIAWQPLPQPYKKEGA